MIFRLIELEHSWKTHLALWAFVCLFDFGVLPSIGHPLITFDMVIVVTCFSVIYPGRVRPIGTRLESALPIHARNLFASHLLVDITYCWVYIFTAVAAAVAISHLDLSAVALDASAVTTVGLVARHSVGMHEWKVRRKWRWIIGLGTYAVLIAALGMHYKPEPAVAPAYVLPACALAAVALFWIDWVSFPQAFEIAPREPVEQKSANSRLRLPAFAGLPILRSFAGKESIAFSCALLVVGCIGTVFFGIVIVFISFFVTIAGLRGTGRWLFLLPISRHKLFAATILPPLGSFALGSLFGVCFSSRPPREAILGVATVAAASLLALFAAELPSLLRRLGAAWVVLLTCAASSSVAWAVWRWCRPTTNASGIKTLPIETIVGKALPDRLPLLIVASAMGVIALYWLAYAGFRRLQVKPQRMTLIR
ncbi:MAG: hypothetical protein ACRD4R_01045 [Candidatus Acidiferrales bacterium]